MIGGLLEGERMARLLDERGKPIGVRAVKAPEPRRIEHEGRNYLRLPDGTYAIAHAVGGAIVVSRSRPEERT